MSHRRNALLSDDIAPATSSQGGEDRVLGPGPSPRLDPAALDRIDGELLGS